MLSSCQYLGINDVILERLSNSSVSLLKFMMPLVKINVKHHHRSSSKSSHQESTTNRNELDFNVVNAILLLIMWKCQTSDTRITGRKCIKKSQIKCSPNLNYIKIDSETCMKDVTDLYNALVPPCHHVFSISGHQHALDRVWVKITSQLLPVDGEHGHVVAGVRGHHQPLPAQAEVVGAGQLGTSLQRPQEVTKCCVNQERSVLGPGYDQTQLCRYNCAGDGVLMTCQDCSRSGNLKHK